MVSNLIYHELFELITAIDEDPQNRLVIMPELSEITQRLKSEGLRVPSQLCELEESMRLEEQNLLFENMPV